MEKCTVLNMIKEFHVLSVLFVCKDSGTNIRNIFIMTLKLISNNLNIFLFVILRMVYSIEHNLKCSSTTLKMKTNNLRKELCLS